MLYLSLTISALSCRQTRFRGSVFLFEWRHTCSTPEPSAEPSVSSHFRHAEDVIGSMIAVTNFIFIFTSTSL